MLQIFSRCSSLSLTILVSIGNLEIYSTSFFGTNPDNSFDFEYGIRWNYANKKVGVKALTNLVSDDIMEETHYLTIEEYLNFGRMKNNTYAANYGHDDTVMSDITIAYFLKSNNIFATAYLQLVESSLRLLMNDESEEVKMKKAEEKRKQESIYKYNGFNIRNHNEEINKNNIEDMYLFGF